MRLTLIASAFICSPLRAGLLECLLNLRLPTFGKAKLRGQLKIPKTREEFLKKFTWTIKQNEAGESYYEGRADWSHSLLPRDEKSQMYILLFEDGRAYVNALISDFKNYQSIEGAIIDGAKKHGPNLGKYEGNLFQYSVNSSNTNPILQAEVFDTAQSIYDTFSTTGRKIGFGSQLPFEMVDENPSPMPPPQSNAVWPYEAPKTDPIPGGSNRRK